MAKTPRPLFLIFIAVLGILSFAGIIALFAAAGLLFPKGETDVPSIVAGMAFALFRLATAIGLLRLQRWARIVEQLYQWIKMIVLGVLLGMAASELEWQIGLVLLWLIAFSLVIALYLRKPDVRLLFSRRIDALPEEERNAVQTRLRQTSPAQWAVMILGIVTGAAVAITASSNLSNAVQRNRQKQTMKDMRTIATAWEARATDLNRYNAAGAVLLPKVPVSAAELNRNLAPVYIVSVPSLDGWGHPYTFHLDAPFGGTTGAETYLIRSFGRDGKASPLGEQTTSDFDCDIVFSNGSFLVYPEGRSGEGGFFR